MERKADKEKRGIPPIAWRILCLCMAIIMMIGVSGCMFKSSEEIVAPKMLKYMEEKYGEKFRLSDNNFMHSSFAGTPTSLFLLPESHPDWYVTVKYEPGEPFSDNYVAYLKMDEVHDYLKPYFDQVYGPECRLFVYEPVSTPTPNDFDKDTDIVKYLSVMGANVMVYTNKDFSTSDADAKKMWDIQNLVNYSISVRIYYLSSDVFNSESAQTQQKEQDLTYLYLGDILLFHNLRGKEFKGVHWRQKR